MPQIDFDNTEIAFKSKTDIELFQSYLMFKTINNNHLTKIAPKITEWALKLYLPIIPLIKATVYKQFCGGTSIHDCSKTISKLYESNIGTILDYSVEGEEKEEVFEATAEEIKQTILKATNNPKIPFSVFKITGLARFDLLAKVQLNQPLSDIEKEEFNRVKQRVMNICALAHEHNVSIFIDAEESWIQDAIDALADEMMHLFNTSRPIVYNTFQMYRWDRLEFFKKSYERALQKGYFLGAKLVRGAYMEKEAARAVQMGYTNPIQPSKEATDKDYDKAISFSIEHIDRIAICAGTHNENSSRYLVELMNARGIPHQHPHVYFSQLLGMSDNLSYNLAAAGFNVAKYVPYGPVRSVLPYLFRRANENTSIAGQMGRELSLIVKERARRKKVKV